MSTCIFREAGQGWEQFRFRIWRDDTVVVSRGYPTHEAASEALHFEIARLA